MNIRDFLRVSKVESESEFVVGAGDVLVTASSLGFSRSLRRGLRLRANSSNSSVIFAGQAGVSTTSGFSLSPGEEIFLEVDDPSIVYVIAAAPGDRYSWIGQ